MSEDNQFVEVTAEADGGAPIILGEPPSNFGAGDFIGGGDYGGGDYGGGDYGGGDYGGGDFAGGDYGDFAAQPESNEAQYLGDISAVPIPDTPIVLEAGVDNVPAPAEPEVPAGPTPMQKWNDEWQQTLLERKKEEDAAKAELVEKARVDMEKFQDERDKKRQAKMAKNREDEQAKLEAIEADLENDNSWQKVCKLVELSHDGTQTGDVKRMIDTLILLKNDKSKAEALSA